MFEKLLVFFAHRSGLGYVNKNEKLKERVNIFFFGVFIEIHNHLKPYIFLPPDGVKVAVTFQQLSCSPSHPACSLNLHEEVSLAIFSDLSADVHFSCISLSPSVRKQVESRGRRVLLSLSP